MNASPSLASQELAKHVVAQVTQPCFGMHQTHLVASSFRHLFANPLFRGPRTYRRSITSIRSEKNHLRDVKEYTAANPVTIWKSNSRNPYENLAIENYILKNSDPASRILYTYVNWPCVVIGRNQNPWLECNLARMQQGLPDHQPREDEEQDDNSQSSNHIASRDGKPSALDLVRRRSGGGTVIHDSGNLNFSFIVPNDKDFTRDTHAQLVVNMLGKIKLEGTRKAYYTSVRVNERHDIVMLRRQLKGELAPNEFKISGSAFKLTRGRALHHGTILHSSPNIVGPEVVDRSQGSIFSEILSSPAKPYLDAKGVGSVRSPVHNLFKAKTSADRGMYSRELQSRLQEAFRISREVFDIEVQNVGSSDCSESSNKQIFDDIQELLTDEWRFCQTPSFDFSSAAMGNARINFQVKHGIIGTPSIKDTKGILVKGYESLAALEGKALHKIVDWSEYFPTRLGTSAALTSHLATIFPKIDPGKQDPRGQIEQEAEQKVETKAGGERNVVVVKRRSANGSVETEREGENLVVER